MPSNDPADRALASRIAAHTSWANTENRSARTAPARAALMAKFEQQVDPDGTLTPQERAKRAKNAKLAHFARLSLLSARSRRKSRELTEQAQAAEAEVHALGGDAS
jgi:hypothetical protein